MTSWRSNQSRSPKCKAWWRWWASRYSKSRRRCWFSWSSEESWLNMIGSLISSCSLRSSRSSSFMSSYGRQVSDWGTTGWDWIGCLSVFFLTCWKFLTILGLEELRECGTLRLSSNSSSWMMVIIFLTDFGLASDSGPSWSWSWGFWKTPGSTSGTCGNDLKVVPSLLA